MTLLPHGRGTGLGRGTLALGLLCSTICLLLLAGGGLAAAKPQQGGHHGGHGHKPHKGKCTKKGTKGPDILRGTKKKDVLCGKGGDDVIYGLKGKDTLKGGGGNDILIGSSGSDTIKGGAGADMMTGGSGSDTLSGGSGSDTAAFSDATGPVTVDLVEQKATGVGTDKLESVENAIGSAFADTLTGNTSNNTFNAGSGDDMMIGGGGNDSLNGDTGVDTVTYADATQAITADLSAGTMQGEGSDSGASIEILVGSPKADDLTGGAGNDIVYGGGGNDKLTGGAGDDVLYGEEGDDKVYGEEANDSLHGDGGDDLVDGGGGINACDGGSGANTFAGNCDSGPPEIADVRVSPASVDTSGSEQTVQFQIDAGDDLAGVDVTASQVTIHSPSGATRSAELTQLSGNSINGTFGSEFTIPRYAAQGTYTADVTLVDRSGNSATTESAELISLGYDGSFEQSGPGDSTAPVPTGLTMTPSSVDTSAADQNLSFTVKATDDLSGVRPADSWVSVRGPDGIERVWTDLTRVSGTEVDGTFTGTVTLPRYSPQGAYTLALKLVDQAGNERIYESTELLDGGMTGGFNQTGLGDTVAPTLNSFVRSPSTTDTRESSQTVSVTIGATDALSGIDLANSKVIIRDPNGRIDSTNAIVASGTNTYKASPVLRRGSAPGIWKIDVVIYDRAGNVLELNSFALGQLGYQSTFQNLGIAPT